MKGMDMSKITPRAALPLPLVALAAVTLLLPGCRKAPEQPPQNMTMELPETPAQPPAPPTPAPEPASQPKVENKVVLPAATDISEDEQMREDAEATGMTSRVSSRSDNASGSPDNEGNPAQH